MLTEALTEVEDEVVAVAIVVVCLQEAVEDAQSFQLWALQTIKQ
jgi:hypothetical protein